MTRIATFLLLLAGGLVALLFAVRLIAAAFNWDFSPFTYITPGGGHALLAWLLLLGDGGAGRAWSGWCCATTPTPCGWPSPAGDGGVLVPNADLERPATSAAGRSHPDVVRAEVEFFERGAELRGRVTVWARPLAERRRRARRQPTRPRSSARWRGSPAASWRGSNVRVKVLKVTQLARYLP